MVVIKKHCVHRGGNETIFSCHLHFGENTNPHVGFKILMRYSHVTVTGDLLIFELDHSSGYTLSINSGRNHDLQNSGNSRLQKTIEFVITIKIKGKKKKTGVRAPSNLALTKQITTKTHFSA